jgi:SET domain-containing protein
MNVRTDIRGVVATRAIPAGEVLGQYLGHVQLLGPPCRNAPANEGYRMHLKTRTTGHKYVGIDALYEGGMLRKLNHSCNPAARFHEVQTRDTLTVVAVTIRDVFPGEEVTVSYGDRLWFVCRCGWWGCQHRDLQHLTDISAEL